MTDSSAASTSLSTEALLGVDDRWRPRHFPESAWHEHGLFARWLIKAIRPDSLVELGTHNGYSYFVFCETISDLGLATAAHAIDTWQGDDQAGFYGDDVYSAVRSVNDREYAEFSTLHRGYFDEFVDEFPTGSIDLLHIDGRHGYEDVTADFQSWLPKISERGVVMFHDIAEHQPGFGVWQLWAELREQYPSFEFHHGHGLGVLAVGGSAPAAIRWLTAMGPPQRERITRYFERWGSAVTCEYELGVARSELRIKSAQFAEQAETIARLNDAIARLNEEIAVQTARRSEQERSVSWRITKPLRTLRRLAGHH